MRRSVVVPISALLALAGCVAHTGLEPAGGEAPAEEKGPASPAADRAAGPAAPAAAVRECPFLGEVPPIAPSPGLPRVAAPAGVTATDVRATIRVGADGGMAVGFDIDLENAGAAQAEARIGWSFRTPGGRIAKPLPETVRFGEGHDVRACSASSPPREHGVWTDEAVFAVVPIPAGGKARVQGEASFTLRRSEAPATLFGYRDAAALNLKNFPWSYLGDAAYEAQAARIRPFHGTFDLVPAKVLRVIISGEARVNWMRAMSHEQNGAVLRSPGTFGWNFMEGDAPPRVGFEYNPDLPVGEEVGLFEGLVAARKDDLRAMIHLADLRRFGGDQTERVAVLEALLAAWDANAGEQLLAGGNDVRAAIYVALVRNLHLLDRKAEAKARAVEGLAIVEELDPAMELNRAAAKWLKAYSD